MQKYIDKAKILVEALPYIKEFSGITVVIKYGGAALINSDIKNTIMQDIALMKLVGFRPVVVHGGGPDINQMLTKLNIESKFENGLRVTDGPTMEVVEMVLAGSLNKAITTQLSMQGIKTVGISGKDGQMLKAEPIPGLGQVGNITHVNTHLIDTLLDSDYVPVISPIGFDEHGNSLNINADYAAVAVASALSAEKLVFLTDVAGILNNGSVMPRASVSEAKEMIEQGVITGGMIPKVECCVGAVNSGVKSVHILDGRVEHCLLLEIFTKDGIGTLIEE